MKNKEKYAKEIIEIACDGNSIAVDKQSKKFVSCISIPCRNCLFYISNDGCCDNKGKREWAESEYIEKPVISKKDRAFLEYLDNDLKYIARDKNSILMAYEHTGEKDENSWMLDSGSIKSFFRLNVQLPMVKWEDEKPWLIEDLKKLEVVEEYEK